MSSKRRVQRSIKAWSFGDYFVIRLMVAWFACPLVEVFIMAFRAESAFQLVNALGLLGFLSAFLGIFLSAALKPRYVCKYKASEFAAIEVDESVAARCPDCGAELSYDDVTAVCNHCGTESILPALLIPVSKKNKYRRVIAAKTRGAEIENSYKQKVNYWTRKGGVLLSVYTVVWYLLMSVLPPAEDYTGEGNNVVVPVLGCVFRFDNDVCRKAVEY